MPRRKRGKMEDGGERERERGWGREGERERMGGEREREDGGEREKEKGREKYLEGCLALT